ncbi:DUF6950 family protein [Agrobacterium tumefaciens]|uniref:DUF6950 family protein n=1 Tax=Agrobacterium tumefaciens TaxID=358 RepID=UPI000DD3AC76|nr:hypothetical protein [Agrobacterium tumefaciens]
MAELVKARHLAAFLASTEREPWTPGDRVDCCLVLAEWAIWLGYPDPAAHLRGAYQPGQGQLDILAESGGAIALVKSCAAALSLSHTDTPQAGDIGVVGSAHNITRQFGVIHDGAGWLTRTPHGFARVAAKTLAAWRL